MINNYIIGLGGTGGASIAAFRRATKRRAEEFNALISPSQLGNVRFQYLYIDSNEKDIEDARLAKSEKWRVPGADIHMHDSDCLCIDGHGMNMQAAYSMPNIAPWIGNTAGIERPENMKITGAGQRRRYGRMLLTRRVAELNQRVANGAEKLMTGSVRPNELTFHIFATLGGGTGSGSVVDMVTYLRHKFPEAQYMVDIYLYLYVGGGAPSVVEANAGFLYENEYAALRDLNALMSNRWHPDMGAVAQGGIHKGQDPINAVFLSSEMSDISLPLNGQVECMANVCFDIISMDRRSDGDMLKMFTGEDLIPNNPGEVSDNSQYGAAPQTAPPINSSPERSYRFATLGVSRLKEPVMEIRGQLKCKFAEAVIDRWLNGAASSNARTSRDLSAAGNNAIYDLDDPGRNLPSGNTAFSRHLAQFEEGVWAEFREATGSDTDGEGVSFDDGSLNVVTSFVKAKQAAIAAESSKETAMTIGAPQAVQQYCKAQAEELVSAIEKALESKCRWSSVLQAGETVWGVSDAITYVQNLCNALDTRTSPDFSDSVGNMQLREQEWEKITGLTSLLTSKQEKMFKDHVEEGRLVLAYALWVRSVRLFHYMEKNELVKCLTTLKAKLRLIETELTAQKKNQQEQFKVFLQKAQEASPEEVLMYDKDRVKKHVDYLGTSPDAEAQFYAASLRTFETNMPPGGKLYDTKYLDSMDTQYSFWSESARIHDELGRQFPDDYKSAYHRDIYEAWEEGSAKEKKLEELRRKLGTLAGLSPAPKGGQGLLDLESPPPKTAIYVGTPDCTNHKSQTTTDNLKSQMKANIGGHASPGKYYEFSHDDHHEIRIMQCKHWLPVRYFSVLGILEEKFLRTMAKNDDNSINARYYSNIDDKDAEKPEVIPASAGGARQENHKFFELATRLPIPGCVVAGGTATVARRVQDNALEVILTEELLRETPVYYAQEYPATAIPYGDDDLHSHLGAAIAAWVRHYGKTEGSSVVASITREMEELNSKADASPRDKQMLYSLRKHLEGLLG